jgi:hypothetical protein
VGSTPILTGESGVPPPPPGKSFQKERYLLSHLSVKYFAFEVEKSGCIYILWQTKAQITSAKKVIY